MNPLAALWIVPIAWVATASGRRLNRLVCRALATELVAPIERTIFGLATGYVFLAMGVLALGLLGLLSPLPVALWCVAPAIFGGAEHGAMFREARAGIGGRIRPEALGCALFALIALGGCFVPPTSSEWDSLSYHLADPKLYVAAHRIYYIPWESHSNFAFNMEMLYSIGMLAHSIALAKLFHFTIGAAAVIGVYRLAARIEPKLAGLSAIIFATLPLVFWEAGTAYVDLAATAYATLALLALALMAQTKDRRFALLAGVMLGGMFGIKATSLITIALYALGILAHGYFTAERRAMPKEALASAAAMVAIAMVIGCPWYVKSAVYTGNPFYPFGYSVLGGRYWNETNSVAYSAAQSGFGVGHKVSDLVMSPWNLTMYLVPNHVPPSGYTLPFNDYQTLLSSLSPLFLIALIAALAVPLRTTLGIRLLTAYAFASLAVWFLLTQQVRYLMPVTPVLCILAAWVLRRLKERSPAAKAAKWVALAGGIGFNLVVFVQNALLQWPVALHPESQDDYIARGLDSYPAMQYLNTAIDPAAKVLTIGEPRVLYLDRDHALGDMGVHPEYPPYDDLKTPAALHDWLTERGYRYILLNRRYADLHPNPGWEGMVYALTVGSGAAPVYEAGRTAVYAL